MRSRPAVRSITATVTVDGKTERRHGYALDDVLRFVAWETQEHIEYNDEQMAGIWGMAKGTYRDWMDNGTSMRLSTLSEIVAALRTTPASLFSNYADFSPTGRSRVTDIDQSTWGALRHLLSNDRARRVLGIINALVRTGRLEKGLEMAEQMLGIVPAPPSPIRGKKSAESK